MNNVVITAGIHGNEVGGTLAAFCLQKTFPQIPTYTVLNPMGFIQGTRRTNGKDLNRQFGKNDVTANNILQKVLSHQPSIVITLHEDDEVDHCYIYCNESLRSLAEQSLTVMHKRLPGLPRSVHGDKPDNGVITHGKYPVKGTLEKELSKLGINYICFETPQLKNLNDRIKALTHGVAYFISHLK